MPKQFDLVRVSDTEDYGIQTGADWALLIDVAGAVTEVQAARMEVRRTSSSAVILSFYSDATGIGSLVITDLRLSLSLDASVTEDEAFTFTGRARYDLFITNQDGKEDKLLLGGIDINPRITRETKV